MIGNIMNPKKEGFYTKKKYNGMTRQRFITLDFEPFLSFNGFKIFTFYRSLILK